MLRKRIIVGCAMLLLVTLTAAACGAAMDERPSAVVPPASTSADVSEDENGEDESAATTAPESEAGDTDAGGGALPTPTASPVPDFDPAATAIALLPMADGFDRPLYLTHAGDDSNRMFVVEQGGQIHILRDGERLAEPFLDISDRVNDASNEQGLLGMAFAPNYAETGQFFVNYTDAEDATVVARFTVSADNPDQADPDSEFQILRVAQPARNHNAGMLAFGPDGYLYVGMGDGGAADDRFNNGQNPTTLLGKMLRLDVLSDPTEPYLIPPDNPWITADWNGVDVPDEIWAVGLRNPWRYSFDRATGDLWLADVGQRLYEEINLIPAPEPDSTIAAINFGWPIMEGKQCFPDDNGCDQTGLTLPVADYRHERGACSVTGGYVYRGEAFSELQGVYLFADYCNGELWTLHQIDDGTWQQQTAIEDAGNISSFGENQTGELYVLDLSAGTISQIVVDETQ